MARETKIGLLVGLAFIICFSIILANRGRQDSMVTQFPRDLLIEKQLTSAAYRNQRQPDLTQPELDLHDPEASLRRPSTAMEHDPHSQSGQRELSWSHRHSASDPGVASPGASTEEMRSRLALLEKRLSELAGDESSGAQVADGGAAALGRDPTGGANVEYRHRRADLPVDADPSGLANRGAHRTRSIGSEDGAERSLLAPDTGSKRTADKTVSHTVAKGETLTSIARGRYGAASRTVLDAILDANRSTISSIDEIREGQQLVLPTIGESLAEETAQPAAEKPAPADNPSTGKKSPSPSADFRWYEIRERDTYASIAREQLDDGRRWRELFELNKDIFPDADRIRAGVQIRIPAESLAMGGEHRR